jgi:SDR family mycofactocin-dependent oxidoreductase
VGLLDGKVAVITGAARGQGRAHATRFAEEGADIIAMDICRDVETISYNLATPEDLQETVAAVEKLDRRILATETDTRDFKAVTEAVDRGVAEFGRVDVLVANAGIGDSYAAAQEMSEERWLTMVDINLNGVWRACRAAIPHMIEAGRGGCLILTSSSAAYVGLANLGHYSAAKAGVVGLMQSLAVELGPHLIRVNTLHPTTVNTPMALNQSTYDLFLPGAGLSVDRAEDQAQVAEAFKGLNAMPIPWIEPVDLANAAVFLASDWGRYVSGTQLRVDAGSGAK